MEALAAFQSGIASIAAGSSLKEQAARNLQTWLTHRDFAAYKSQLDWMIQSAKWSELLDAFYQVLPFGTGGRRGAVGIGPNSGQLPIFEHSPFPGSQIPVP